MGYGFGMLALAYANDASSFLLVFGLAAYFFSHKMVRLVLLTAPIASVCAGIAVGRVAGMCVEGVCGWNLDAWEIFSWGGSDVVSTVEAKVVSAARNGASEQ